MPSRVDSSLGGLQLSFTIHYINHNSSGFLSLASLDTRVDVESLPRRTRLQLIPMRCCDSSMSCRGDVDEPQLNSTCSYRYIVVHLSILWWIVWKFVGWWWWLGCILHQMHVVVGLCLRLYWKYDDHPLWSYDSEFIVQILRQRTARKTILTLHNKTSDGLLCWRRLEKEILEKHQQKVKSTTHWPYRMDNARGVNRKNCTTIGDFVPSLPGLRKVNPPNDLRFNRCHS